MLRKLLVLSLLIASFVALPALAPAASVAQSPERSSSPCQGPAAESVISALPSQATSELQITVVYDNVSTEPTRLVADWGYAAVLRYDGHTILFDAGDAGLLFNLNQLGIDPKSIEAVIISHENHDHFGGLQSLFDAGLKPTVYVPCMFTKAFKSDIGSQTKLIEISDVTEIVPGMRLTRPMGCIVEQALAVDTPDGTVVITGCAHPGVVNIVRAAKEMTGRDITLLAGGFHFFPLDDSEVLPIIAELQQLGVQRVMPAHCTFISKPTAPWQAAYGDNYIPAGVGATYTVPTPKS
jgi:7,8-dihydropterin-6-yl-methyl-4-(beta-D-ribofuranosyl)aminobenzene 5'-phosphate synthase